MKKDKFIPAKKVFKEWSKSPGFRKAYDELEVEFALANALISARVKAGLSQKELAKRMQTTQPFIARMESGKQLPSTATLTKLAAATHTKLRISFVEA